MRLHPVRLAGDKGGDVDDSTPPRIAHVRFHEPNEPDDVHQFRNSGNGPLKFLCLVPNSALSQQVRVAPECGR